MRNNIKKICLISVVFVGLLFFSSSVYAHYPWVNVSDYTPDTGSALKMTIGWGHKYPINGFLDKQALEKLDITGPEKVNLSFVSGLEVESEEGVSTPGVYIVSALRKPGFYTKTTQGGKRSSKKGLKGVIRCSFSHMCTKAIVNVGDGKGKVDTVIGHPMEIIPLKNPADLRAGDYMPVKVLCNGKPFNDYIYATYAGFSTRKDVFAYAVKTDKKGKAEIRILKSGIWLIKAGSQQPYPDQKVCDFESYIGTLTFEVE